ncbi:hypothetical protein MIND_00433300 [Mycena indigotica]|uniref:Uncharacterized protein n=1 Tax=Mycena indigotica TaxID=2126181 RepID=A0A8H6W823_9AGAR|nr:uncharacterized protein MIND_00433300 [Mycena indigotica]KAF7306421.1 hypothetical protein MIND_00433300 [Mycena indigotica]
MIAFNSKLWTFVALAMAMMSTHAAPAMYASNGVATRELAACTQLCALLDGLKAQAATDGAATAVTRRAALCGCFDDEADSEATDATEPGTPPVNEAVAAPASGDDDVDTIVGTNLPPGAIFENGEVLVSRAE